jgi:hypothetical protein
MIWKPDLEPDASGADAEDEFDEIQKMLQAHVSEFAEEHDLSFEMLALLLVSLGLTSRMMEYVMSVERPSGLGLKRDLDRFGRNFDDLLRNAKRGADDFVSRSMDLRQQIDESEPAEDALDPENGTTDQKQAAAKT